jgi:predicted dehydrogenase
VRILLVGVGRWGEKHLRVLRALGATVWVADVAAERRQWAIAQGIAPDRVVADYRTMLAAVDAVSVVTPADSHVEIALAALAAGRHCFVEKPLATTVAGGHTVAAAAGAAGRVVQVGHVFRFHPVTDAIRDALEAGRVGPVRYATGRFAGFKRPRADVGVTHTDAVHYFDLFAYLLGRPATRVRGLQRDFLGRGLDDMSVTVVEYGDVPVVVEASCFGPGSARECVVVGARGVVVADYASGTATIHCGEHRRRGDAWEAVDTGKEELLVGRAEPLEIELRAFLDACAGRRPNPVPAEAGVDALRVAEAAAAAARYGSAVALAERGAFTSAGSGSRP